jgi:signal transduction histidine kinase
MALTSVLHLLIVVTDSSDSIPLTQVLGANSLFFSYDLAIGEREYLNCFQEKQYQGIIWLDSDRDFAHNPFEKIFRFLSFYKQFQDSVPLIAISKSHREELIDTYLSLGFTGYSSWEKFTDCLDRLKQEYFYFHERKGDRTENLVNNLVTETSHSCINKNINILHEILNVSCCWIMLRDRDRKLIVRYISQQTLQHRDALSPRCFFEEFPLCDCERLTQLSQDENTAKTVHPVANSASIPATLETPLHYQNLDLGFLILQDYEGNRQWDEREVNLANIIAQNCAIALYQERLEQKLQRQKEREKFLDRIDGLFDSNAEIDTILQAVMEKIGIFFNVERVLGLTIEQTDVWVKYEWRDREEISSLLGLKLPASAWQKELTQTEKLGEYHYFLAVNYPEYCQDRSHSVQHFKKESPRSLLSVPSIFRGKFYGGLSIQTISQERIFDKIEIKTLSDIARRIAIALSQVQQQQIATKLERENRQKSEHFSMMSHDLRTPLTGILGFARMLLDRIYGDLNPKQMEYISAIASSSEHLLELINDLLDLARIEANREELYLEKLSIEEVCLASISIVKQLAHSRALELKLEIVPHLTTCMADQRRLKQILVNLLSNAIKFTESGSVTLKVRQTQNRLEFSVIDTGIGIAEADIEKLFKPFSQIKNRLQRQYKGTGLGLALSKKLARLHGGDLNVSSQLENGSCFTFYLPL